MRILRSLEEFLYEVMTWLVFYPRMLWRTMSHPLAVMEYSHTELNKPEDEQYQDTLSAPLFLLLTLVISHLLEMALHLHPLQRVGHGAEKLFGSDQNLILLRALMFAIFPLMFALEQVRASDQALTRKSLRGPFFGECYPAAVFCLMFGIGGTLLQTSPNLGPLGLGIMILAVAWYVTVQAVWLHRFKRSWGRAVWVSAGCFLKGAVFLSLAAIAVGIAVLA